MTQEEVFKYMKAVDTEIYKTQTILKQMKSQGAPDNVIKQAKEEGDLIARDTVFNDQGFEEFDMQLALKTLNLDEDH